MKPTLHLAIERANPVIGWGVCYSNLKSQFSKHTNLIDINDKSERFQNESHPGTAFCSIANNMTLERAFPASFDRMFGYTFFEEELFLDALHRLEEYELVFAGSSWCVEKLREYGVHHTDTLIQGVDTDFFNGNGFHRKDDGMFKIFSGGKFEYRKGQDIVTAAFKKLQHKYKDMELVCCWWNPWPHSYHTMQLNHLTEYPVLEEATPWLDRMSWYFAWNKIYPGRVTIHGPLTQQTMRRVMLDTDIGVFPNRCEGGTNLVLMEYMALGKPAIATYSSGHKDILTESNSFPIMYLKESQIIRNHRLVAQWDEPDVDEVVAAIEYAYEHRCECESVGRQAALDIRRQFTWDKTAEKALRVMFS